jgi:DNA-binding response OmpR family regulator
MNSAATASPHLLVVDDALFEQRMLVDLLTDQGYHVTVAGTGTQGYQLAQAVQPDLIVMDVRMPDMDGMACCRLLQASRATHDIPVIFVSGADSADEKIAGFLAGAVDYVAKPYAGEELLARIRVHLNLARRHRAPPPPEPASSEPDAVLVSAAQRIIADHLGELPGLSEIARRVGTYRERLNALFRQRLGASVFEYVRELRITRAGVLLRDTTMDVRDIAQLVGFRNAGNFATAFRERTGMTPSAWRDANLADGLPDASALPALPRAGRDHRY